MHKIKWDLEKEKFGSDVRTVIICEECGWLISNPIVPDEKNSKIFDDTCPNCGKLYKETKSEIRKIEQKR